MNDYRITRSRESIAIDVYDADGWQSLISELRRKGPEAFAEIRQAYEDLVSKFPTAFSYWRDYCEWSIDNSVDPAVVKSLFSRCLLGCLNAQLYVSYVRFVRRLNQSAGVSGLAEVRQAFEFALDNIGNDIEAGTLWQDYIAFLQAPSLGSPEHQALYGQPPEGQEGDPLKTAAIRKAYHRCLVIPTNEMDALWKSYETFENSVGTRALTKRVLDEWRPRYQAARATLNDRSALISKLDTRSLPVPPGRGGASQTRQYKAWFRYIRWERSNPQLLDQQALDARVSLAFEQALMVFLHFPDMWLEYAEWKWESSGQPGESVPVLEKAQLTFENNLAIYLAVADAYEAAGDVAVAKQVYLTLTEQQQVAQKEHDAAAIQESKAPPPSSSSSTAALARNPEQGTLLWIQYMRFTQRVDGILAARKLFLKARKWPKLRWEAFAAAARMEWRHEHNEKIVRNIYELGLKNHLTEASYVLEYASFLLGLGDVANARALYERSLTTITDPPAAALPIWDAYLELEYEVGSLEAAVAVKERRKAAMKAAAAGPGGEPGPPPLHDALRRSVLKHTFLDLWPAAPHQRAYMEHYAAAPAIGEEDDAESDNEGEHDGGNKGDDFDAIYQDKGTRSTRAAAAAAGGGGGGVERRPGGGRRARSRSPSPSQRARRNGGRSAYDRGTPMPLPVTIYALLSDLPRNNNKAALDGCVPDIETVLGPLLKADLSAEGIAAHEAAMARERRRQRQAAEMDQRQGGDGGGGMARNQQQQQQQQEAVGEKRLRYQDAADEDSESDDDDDGGFGGQPVVDVFRMRRRQAKG
jgi:cleavage stimulation factor subunit 3